MFVETESYKASHKYLEMDQSTKLKIWKESAFIYGDSLKA